MISLSNFELNDSSDFVFTAVDFADDNNDARFAEISAINKRVADSYLANDDDANLYPDWWTKILALGDGE